METLFSFSTVGVESLHIPSGSLPSGKLNAPSWAGLSSHRTQVPHAFRCASGVCTRTVLIIDSQWRLFLTGAFLTEGRLVARASERGRAVCALTKTRPSAVDEPENLEKEAHKYFDQVVITARSGDGGHGSVLEMPGSTLRPLPPKVYGQRKRDEKDKPAKKEKKTGALKRTSDGSLLLPMGGHGGDVILVADETVDTLLDFHKKKRYNAKRGSNVDASGPLTPMLRDGANGLTLRIPVPVGTVVKRKRGGKLLADLARSGDQVTVARGGRGGISMLEHPRNNRRPLKNVGAPIMTDPDDKVLTLGSTGEEVQLELTLRVVADVGLVGLPNAGKSSLLAAVTRAKPEIADYPFTTLMPNLGRLEGNKDTDDGGFASGPTLADLPGLIKGAHLGKGLGRMFLRHLRRTRLLIHVVDAAAEDPIRDYRVLREELYFYNPDYVSRPHIVVLNKLDLAQAQERFENLRETISFLGVNMESLPSKDASNALTSLEERENSSTEPSEMEQDDEAERKGASKDDEEQTVENFRRPVSVVGTSARQGLGMDELLREIRVALEKEDARVKRKPKQKKEPKPLLYKAPQWQI
ncbi:hypothetical protein R1sor_022709 [Riccia sorocarpa]|uniref:GTP-binding protein OBGC2 n=1 Tax=Riccia sorocarpa TaxID=122646 RepID=A0ABD3GKL9_9MARC